MPMKLNIGLTKKVGETNYGSKGASINLEVELDSQAVQDPARLQASIRNLFSLARTSLAEELNGERPNGEHAHGPVTNGSSGQPPTTQPRPATQSQVRAIRSMAVKHRLNLGQFLRDRYQVNRPEDLSLRQASEVIDSLKAHNGQ
jgi:hypothetical protein